jgi:hypothetical protein
MLPRGHALQPKGKASAAGWIVWRRCHFVSQMRKRPELERLTAGPSLGRRRGRCAWTPLQRPGLWRCG